MIRRLQLTPIVFLCLILSACASNSLFATTSISLSQVLFSIQDGELELFDAGLVTEENHQRFNDRMVEVLEAGQAYNQSVLANDTGDINLVANSLSKLTAEIADFTNISDSTRATLISAVDMAIRLVSTLGGTNAV